MAAPLARPRRGGGTIRQGYRIETTAAKWPFRGGRVRVLNSTEYGACGAIAGLLGRELGGAAEQSEHCLGGHAPGNQQSLYCLVDREPIYGKVQRSQLRRHVGSARLGGL